MIKAKLKKKEADSIKKDYSYLWDFWFPLLFTFSLISLTRTYLAEPRYIPSGSMLPGLRINDYLLIEKLTLLDRSPLKGEIVVFNSPFSFNQELLEGRDPSTINCFFNNIPYISIFAEPQPACDAYIKRVVATSGDQVIVSNKGELFIDGVFIEEPYVTNYCSEISGNLNQCKSINDVVPDGHVLVLGDNRANSYDGRYWPKNPFLPEKQIIGKAFFRFFPFDRTGLITP